MSSLSGLVSLQDAFTMETFPSLNPDHLELGPAKQRDSKAYFPHYHQPIFYGGIPLVLQTPAVEMPGLTYRHYAAGEAILMAVSPWLRQQFNIIDAFVREAVTIPHDLLSKWPYRSYSYKPICQDDLVYLILHKSCTITQDTDDGRIDCSPASRPPLSEGLYSLTLSIDYVYLGWHRHNCLYSTHFRITHIHFQPKTLTPD